MSYPGFEDALRRVITGDDKSGGSIVVIDGPPAEKIVAEGMGGLLEIWTDEAGKPIDPGNHSDLGKGPVMLSPPREGVKIRWFIVEPIPAGADEADLAARARARFKSFGAEHHLTDQSRHPAMHETATLDVICLLSGEASLILEDSETRLRPGNVVIQRATNHAWVAHGGPALFLAVLIDRSIQSRAR